MLSAIPSTYGTAIAAQGSTPFDFFLLLLFLPPFRTTAFMTKPNGRGASVEGALPGAKPVRGTE